MNVPNCATKHVQENPFTTFDKFAFLEFFSFEVFLRNLFVSKFTHMASLGRWPVVLLGRRDLLDPSHRWFSLSRGESRCHRRALLGPKRERAQEKDHIETFKKSMVYGPSWRCYVTTLQGRPLYQGATLTVCSTTMGIRGLFHGALWWMIRLPFAAETPNCNIL